MFTSRLVQTATTKPTTHRDIIKVENKSKIQMSYKLDGFEYM